MSNDARNAHADHRNEVARLERHEAEIRRRVTTRSRAQFSRHPDEPGSRSAVGCREIVLACGGVDGLAPYGAVDHTGFGIGCVL